MDKTELYIRMADHELIQAQWIPEEGDFYAPFGKDYIKGYGSVNTVQGVRCIKEERRIEYLTGKIYERIGWLPRQDEIQKMLRRYYAKDTDRKDVEAWFPEGSVALSFVLSKFHEFTIRKSGEVTLFVENAKSFEQLWLQLYMSEVHGKSWFNEQWNL